MIDADKVKAFWERRADAYQRVALESVANLEQNENNLHLKINDETRKVFDWLPPVDGLDILDLGAGVGQWSFRFAERNARRVLAVEYAQGLAEIGRQEAQDRDLRQVEFYAQAAEAFEADAPFDLVFISGLCVYLNDDQLARLLSHVPGFLKPGAMLMLRDGTGVAGRHEIDDRFSEHLQEQYSAIYRTRDDYVRQFEIAGLSLLRDENMFPEGHSLNKYPETRLHLFLFERKR